MNLFYVKLQRLLQLLQCHFLFFFNDTATTEIYTLSLHDALPICHQLVLIGNIAVAIQIAGDLDAFRSSHPQSEDRKSTRLNSSHTVISYAVFCLKKKKNDTIATFHTRRTLRRSCLLFLSATSGTL